MPKYLRVAMRVMSKGVKAELKRMFPMLSETPDPTIRKPIMRRQVNKQYSAMTYLFLLKKGS